MTDPKDFEIYRHHNVTGELEDFQVTLRISDPIHIDPHFSDEAECHELKKQLLAKYPLQSTISVSTGWNTFLVTIGREKLLRTDDLLLQQIEADLENDGVLNFLPIIKDMWEAAERHALDTINWTYPTTPEAVLRELRSLPSVIVLEYFLYGDAPDSDTYDWPLSDISEHIKLNLQHLFQKHFNWDYMISNAKLTADEQLDLRTYINFRLLTLKVSQTMEAILGDLSDEAKTDPLDLQLTDEEEAEEAAELKKAVTILKKGM